MHVCVQVIITRREKERERERERERKKKRRGIERESERIGFPYLRAFAYAKFLSSGMRMASLCAKRCCAGCEPLRQEARASSSAWVQLPQFTAELLPRNSGSVGLVRKSDVHPVPFTLHEAVTPRAEIDHRIAVHKFLPPLLPRKSQTVVPCLFWRSLLRV